MGKLCGRDAEPQHDDQVRGLTELLQFIFDQQGTRSNKQGERPFSLSAYSLIRRGMRFLCLSSLNAEGVSCRSDHKWLSHCSSTRHVRLRTYNQFVQESAVTKQLQGDPKCNLLIAFDADITNSVLRVPCRGYEYLLICSSF